MANNDLQPGVPIMISHRSTSDDSPPLMLDGALKSFTGLSKCGKLAMSVRNNNIHMRIGAGTVEVPVRLSNVAPRFKDGRSPLPRLT